MKPIIVGEAPSKNEAIPQPIGGRIGKRLAACAGLSLPEFLEHFERVNLLKVRQDTKEKGFEFDADAAQLAAYNLRVEWGSNKIGYNPRTVICLGKRVAKAFGVPTDYFTKHMLDHDFYVIPHPSGVNRWWNDEGNKTTASEFMRIMVYNSRTAVAK